MERKQENEIERVRAMDALAKAASAAGLEHTGMRR